MNVYSALRFKGTSPILEQLNAFPIDPENGQMVFVDGVVFVYTVYGGTQSWYPITNKQNSFVHTQGVESTSWVINHNLNTSDFIFFVYDTSNALMQPQYEYVSNNQFKLNFSIAKKGKVVIFYISDTIINTAITEIGTLADFEEALNG